MKAASRIKLAATVASVVRASTRPGAPALVERIQAVPRLVRATIERRYAGTTLAKLGLVAGAVAYVASPVDLVPEALLPVIGAADDAVVITWAIKVFFEETVELSRRARALKLWLSLRYHGLEGFRASIAGNIRQAQRLAARVDAEPSLDRVAAVPLSAVCFRWTDGDPATLDETNAAILDRVNRRGRVYLSNATVHGHFVLRACITNHRTTDADVDAVVEEVLAAASSESAHESETEDQR